jgi:Dynamin family
VRNEGIGTMPDAPSATGRHAVRPRDDGRGGELVDRALELARVCGREDLARRLELVRERRSHPGIRVPVVGEVKQGKSQLVNALVGAVVCPVADDVATVVPTVVRHGAVARAELVRAGVGATGEAGEPLREVIGLDEVVRRVSREADPRAGGVLHAEVALPRTLLRDGLELVDTPGFGALGVAGTIATIDLVPTAQAVVFVSDASQPLTASETGLLRQLRELCPHVVVVVSKTDLHGAWQRIVELDRRQLAAEDVDAPVLPVSARLALAALRRQDRDLYAESGLPRLVEQLRTGVVDRAEALARASLAHDLTTVTEHLAVAHRAELAALEDPATGEEQLRVLEAARAAADELRRRSSRWQQVLGDGVADLTADIDHDLRDRSRVVVREAEDIIDGQDPGLHWEEFATWLEQRVAEAVAQSYVWAGQRSEWLAERVVEQFAEDGGLAVPDVFASDPSDVLGSLVDVGDIDRGVLTLRERVLIGLKGSYTGVLMTGLATSLAGMPIINPISLAVGAVIGTKAYRDDKAARLQRRQSEAKAVVRRHLDEVVFQAGKQLKDRLRVVQRTLRDLVGETADETSRSLADAVKAASRSVKLAAADRDARIRVLRRQLVDVDRLARDVARIAPDAEVPAPAAPTSGAPASGAAAPVATSTTPQGSASGRPLIQAAP